MPINLERFTGSYWELIETVKTFRAGMESVKIIDGNIYRLHDGETTIWVRNMRNEWRRS